VRLLLSVASTIDGAMADIAVECEEGATISGLARELGQSAVHGAQPRVVRAEGRHLGVVDNDPFANVALDTAPDLWLRGMRLDPNQRVADSPIRNGELVGIGVEIPDVFAEPGGMVEVRVASGPGAGRINRLVPGSYVLGRIGHSAVRIDDERVPEIALTLEVAIDGAVTITPAPDVVDATLPAPPRRPLDGPIVIPADDPEALSKKKSKKKKHILAYLDRLKNAKLTIDPDADRPLIHLDRLPLEGVSTWEPGTPLIVGDVMLELAVPTSPDASLSPSPAGATLDYNRPPRLLPPTRKTEFRLPSEPRKPDKQPLPWPMIMIPMIMGGAMYYFTRSPFSLMIMVLSPAMMLSNYINSRRGRGARYTDEMKTFVERTRKIERDAYKALVEERGARRRDLPDPAAMLLFATGPRAQLWERRRTDPDWLMARVGTADVPSEVTLADPAREDHEKTQAWTTPDVPVAIPLEKAGVTGIAGEARSRRALGGWLVAQAATLHSPADLGIVVLSDPDGGDAWNWVRWLPHVRRGDDSEVLAGVGVDDETTGRRVAELLALVEARKAAMNQGGSMMSRTPAAAFAPLLVVLDGARRIRLLPGLVSLLQQGPSVGVIFVCLDADERQLPEECSAVVALDHGLATVDITGEATIDAVRPDIVTPRWCERLARALAPIKDVSSEDLSSALPTSSRLLDVLQLDPPAGSEIARRWSSGGRTTKAVIGEGSDGPYAVDIRADGPHGLVAGTTGSGKSELLQTLIAALAVGNRPDEMTFVLIDYKGGAAFKDCNNLPHTVGMVTDLDGHLTTRALESLGAELRRREHQLADADAKDIEDYLAGRRPDDAPMPRLMIVIDEFAALVAELPEFVTGLVDVARRGRSLGVHLILATQRPAGVVTAEIKSNTNLRIALRVTDRNDSQDVIEAPDAGEISKSTPGRGYARLGASSLTPFQSSRVGGRPSGPDGSAAIGLRELSWESIGRPMDHGPAGDEEEDVSIPTDLASLVTAIQDATTTSGITVPPSPWLPPLADVVTLDELMAVEATNGGDVTVPFGLVDVPRQQRRSVASYDVSASGHMAVIGAARSGRSTVLRAFAGLIGREISPRDIHLYGVDCGNNALLPIVGLPHTGAVVTRSEPDRLARLTGRLRGEIGRRQQLLAEQGFADLREQREYAPEDQRLPYLMVLFDRWEGFVQAFESHDSGVLIEQWMQILQEGAGVGIKVILAADRTGLVGRLSTLIEDKLMLRMNDDSDFSAIGMPAKAVPAHMPPGRGFRSEGLLETQVALLTEDDAGAAQVAAIQEIGRKATDRWSDLDRRSAPFRVDPLPSRITFTQALELPDSTVAPTELPIAVGGDTLGLRCLDTIENGPGMLVLGPRRSGRSTALMTMATSALSRGWHMVAVAPRRSPLRDLEGRDGVSAMFTLDAEKDDVNKIIGALSEHTSSPTILMIDDIELLGVDGWFVDAITKHLGKLRDSGNAVVAAGTPDDLGSSYRGPAAALKKSRSGLLLSPGTPNDGDIFGIRLPRSVTGGSVPGRGLLVASGQWQIVQVAEPESAAS
jgi:S-DNA-T family DNA segregation ATPase FtsK/SpoIIIE